MKGNRAVVFRLCSIVCLSLIVLISGCSSPASPSEAQVELSSTRAYNDHVASLAMDGDTETGWVSAGIPSLINIPMLEINFDRAVRISSITIDDSFADGRTEEAREFETVVPSVKSAAFAYTSVPAEGKSAINVFGENLGSGWQAQEVPRGDAPQAFYGEFRTAIQADRVVVDNLANDVIPISFKVFVCEEAVPAESKLDPGYAGWHEVLAGEENEELVVAGTFTESMSVKSVLYVVWEHDSSSQGACLSGLYLQKRLDTPDTAHYPVDFDLLYSEDGEVYEIIEVRDNQSAVYRYEFPENTVVRSLRYLPITEYDGNKPSVGEIVIE